MGGNGGGGGGAGVTAVCIGIETVEGVVGKGIIGIALGVLFSSSSEDIVFEGVVNGVLLLLLLLRAFCNISLCFLFRSSKMFVALDFEESVEESGEKGFRAIGVVVVVVAAFCSKFSPLTGLEGKKKVKSDTCGEEDWYLNINNNLPPVGKAVNPSSLGWWL